MVQAPPRCSEPEFALELIRVEISKDNDQVVTDVYRCQHPGCSTEHSSQQGRHTVESGK